MKSFLVGIILLLFLPGASEGWQRQSVCNDIQERGTINILTLNLLYAEINEREARFKTVVAFIAQQAAQGEPVDVVLLQEVVGGFLSGTQNSSQDLKHMLADQGLMYNLRYCPVNNQIGVLSEGIAILSRCRFLYTFAKTLPTVWETPSQGFDLPLKRRAMMGRIQVPGVGNINIFNTHLCAFCDASERVLQSEALLKFVSEVERLIFWDKAPVILGGDLNVDRETSGGQQIYDSILAAGFEDSYTTHNPCEICCSLQEGYAGCTYGASGNPYTDDLPARIDYIFEKDLDVLQSTVVFNAYPIWVSDHSGVLTRLVVSE
jgi:maltose 6'-phosphate phosphatase